MPNGQYPGPLHPRPIDRDGCYYWYFFIDKQHKPEAVRSKDSQWLREMSHDEEFAVFELAVTHDLSNERGVLYGLRLDEEGTVMTLGTREEQVARFPVPPEGHAWHGYPVWPIMRLDQDRRSRKSPPPLPVLKKMQDAKLIDGTQRKRLAGGRSI